eukprot:6459525-Amphidinium_carterae.1
MSRVHDNIWWSLFFPQVTFMIILPCRPTATDLKETYMFCLPKFLTVAWTIAVRQRFIYNFAVKEAAVSPCAFHYKI